MNSQTSRLNPQRILSGLKDFQRKTVDYVFQRLYLDRDSTHRFLIADEVGLGKTLVARGLIARAIDHLWDKVERIDVIYVCSNADIARQNVNRLNVTEREEFALTSRITLLPVELCDLRKNKLNFVSFTPGTSFDLKSKSGKGEERALLYWLLKQSWEMHGAAPLNVFQGDKGKDTFRSLVKSFRAQEEIDQFLADRFRQSIEDRISEDRGNGVRDLRSRFEELCELFSHSRRVKNIPQENKRIRNQFIGELRAILAKACLEALEPDLIILDEFQRFKHLLEDDDPTGLLARELFDYSDEHSQARVVLLSATPYKMYTLNDEADDEDHYRDFLRTLRFLNPNKEETAEFGRLLSEYRRELLRFTGSRERLVAIKRGLENRLRCVMVRTERLAVSEDRDGMLAEIGNSNTRLEPDDLETYVAMQKIARTLEHEDTLEYWKAAPYLLNFMDEYELKRKFKDTLDFPDRMAEIAELTTSARGVLLPWKDISSYKQIDPGNARLRSLIADTIDRGIWQLLWIPPSLPYYKLGNCFAEAAKTQFTKRLIFSSWRVVPRAIATLLSYEAERRMIRSFEKSPSNSPEARKRRHSLLRFSRTDDRLTGMPVLGLLYPCMVLARECDPLSFITEGQKNEIPALGEVLERTQERIKKLLKKCGLGRIKSGVEDESWYWAAPILLDFKFNKKATLDWFNNGNLASVWSGGSPLSDESGEESLWAAHVERACEIINGQVRLGRPPENLSIVLAQMAVAGPGIASLRALSRVIGGSKMLTASGVRNSAAQAAWAFLHLFNLPEVMALLRGFNGEEPYWRRVLEYCVEGGLQSVLDEYVHIMRESLGLLDQSSEVIAQSISQSLRNALTLRTSNLSIDDIIVDPSNKGIVIEKSRGMRGRFALRFGEEKADESKEMTRKEQVREAFNSPFWPFVLATTSVGQEGLDFHPYCHAVVHWNLPSNPVDLEQREGRVHRYKGHAVRKNLASHLGISKLNEICNDPWDALFEIGRRERPRQASDLVPFWVFPLEGGAKIERHIPALPLSRDIDRIEELRRSLTLYRMIFGQNRQEDLLIYLLDRIPESEILTVTSDLRIDLSPPHNPDDEI